MAAGIAAAGRTAAGWVATVAAAGRSEVARCMSLGRGLVASDPASRRCRGTAGIPSFYGGGR